MLSGNDTEQGWDGNEYKPAEHEIKNRPGYSRDGAQRAEFIRLVRCTNQVFSFIIIAETEAIVNLTIL